MICSDVSAPPTPLRQHRYNRRSASICDSTSSRRSAVNKLYAGPELLSELSPFEFPPEKDSWDAPALKARLADRPGHQVAHTGSATTDQHVHLQFALKKKLAVRRGATRVLRTIGAVSTDVSSLQHDAYDSQPTRSEQYCLTFADEADEYRCGQCERDYETCECGSEV